MTDSSLPEKSLEQQYAEAAQPFIDNGGPHNTDTFKVKSARYFVEINTQCNLHCSMCIVDNRVGHEHQKGLMDMELLPKILDKIQSENPKAIILMYGNSEPFLHPHLPECIAEVRKRGLGCEVSSNLNHVNRLEDFFAAKPSLLFISLSGFTQDVYVRAHQGGNIDKVKANMQLVAKAWEGHHDVAVIVHYHKYRDNTHPEELWAMWHYAKELGFNFTTSWARVISMENSIQYLRGLDQNPAAWEWADKFPPVTEKFSKNIDRLSINPDKAKRMYAEYPVANVCPIGDAFSFVRHDGQASLCACVADRRLLLGNYLEMTQDQLSEARRNHSFCQECQHHRMNLYFHIIKPKEFDPT